MLSFLERAPEGVEETLIVLLGADGDAETAVEAAPSPGEAAHEDFLLHERIHHAFGRLLELEPKEVCFTRDDADTREAVELLSQARSLIFHERGGGVDFFAELAERDLGELLRVRGEIVGEARLVELRDQCAAAREP